MPIGGRLFAEPQIRTILNCINWYLFMTDINDGIRFPMSLDQMDERLNEAKRLGFTPRLFFHASEVRALQQELLFESASLQWLITRWRTLHGSTKI